jgi:multidrug resistance efflux pump
VAAFIGFGAYRDSQLYVSTDNAQLTGTPIQVGAMNAGRVAAVHPMVGSAVRAGDVVAQVALPTQIGVAQNGQPKLTFLGQADTRVDVQSPIDGVVLAVQTAVGASVQAGQPIVTVTDPSQLWVSANIDETSIARVNLGQPATVHLDTFAEDVPGRVEAITPATASSFSLLPQATTTGTFSKVTQVVPVRIAVNLGNQPALLGTSVEVKIRVD